MLQTQKVAKPILILQPINCKSSQDENLHTAIISDPSVLQENYLVLLSLSRILSKSRWRCNDLKCRRLRFSQLAQGECLEPFPKGSALNPSFWWEHHEGCPPSCWSVYFYILLAAFFGQLVFWCIVAFVGGAGAAARLESAAAVQSVCLPLVRRVE